MDYGLKGKVAIVTGANDGIGLATTKAFLNEGAKVVAVSLSNENVKTLADRDTLLTIDVDLTKEEAPERILSEAIEHFGKIDILANIAGIAIYKSSFLDITKEDWDKTFATNLFAVIGLTKAAIPHLQKQQGASIVNIASESGHVPDEFAIDYSASKAAIINLTSALANEFGEDIRINVVSPGPTRTSMWNKPGGMVDMLAEKFNKEPEEAVSHFAKNVRQIPRGQVGRPEEIANAVVFLASDLAAYIHGAEVPVNGGSVKYK